MVVFGEKRRDVFQRIKAEGFLKDKGKRIRDYPKGERLKDKG